MARFALSLFLSSSSPPLMLLFLFPSFCAPSDDSGPCAPLSTVLDPAVWWYMYANERHTSKTGKDTTAYDSNLMPTTPHTLGSTIHASHTLAKQLGRHIHMIRTHIGPYTLCRQQRRADDRNTLQTPPSSHQQGLQPFPHCLTHPRQPYSH